MTQGEALKVQDIYLPLNHLFNQAAKKAFQREVKELNPVRDITFLISTRSTVMDKVLYFGSRAVGERKIFDAAQKVANQINSLADMGMISGVMESKLMLLQVATEPFQVEQYVVISYVAVTPEGQDYLKNNPSLVQIQEGEMPRSTD